jgi:CHAT domain-containing protein
MPFHAAGKHALDSSENAYCKAISSYTPPIRALAHSIDRATGVEAVRGRLLIATMTTTPGLTSLPGVIRERDKVLEAKSGFLTVEVLDQPSATQVIESLKQCSIAHFACHGYTDHADPSNSGLVQTSERSEPPKQDIVTVHDVSEINSKHARIAFFRPARLRRTRWRSWRTR